MSGVAFRNFTEVSGQQANCDICWAQATEGLEHELKVTRAFHRFHTECLERWFETSKTCPTCTLRVTSIRGEAVEMTRNERGEAVRVAVSRGAIEEVRDLLSGHTIYQEDRGEGCYQGYNRWAY